MEALDNSQALKKRGHRFTTSDCLPGPEYSQFREYCSSCNIFFVDELQPYDYVAFQAQFNTEIEFTRKIRSLVESAISDQSDLATGDDNSVPVAHDLVTESSTLPDEKLTISWEQSVQATAEAYMTIPLDNLGLPNRVRHRLMSAGIMTIGKLLLTTPEQFQSIGFLGSQSLDAIKVVTEDLVKKHINQSPSHTSFPSEASQETKPNLNLLEHVVTSPYKQIAKREQPESDPSENAYGLVTRAVLQDQIDIPLDNLQISARAHHRLEYAGFNTVNKVLLATDEELLSIRHLGNALLQEIRGAKSRFLQDYIDQNPYWQEKLKDLPLEIEQHNKSTGSDAHIRLSSQCRLYIEDIFSGVPQQECKTSFTLQETQVIKRLKQSVDVLGSELCKQFYKEPEIARCLMQTLQTYINCQETKRELLELLEVIPESRRRKQLSPFIKLFNLSQGTTDDELLNVFASCESIEDVKNSISVITEYRNQGRIKKLLKWLSQDISEVIKPILVEIIGEDRKGQILSRRARGDTLELISGEFDLTRERIRQIEAKAFREFSKYNISSTLLIAMSVELNGQTIITGNDFQNKISEPETLLYLLRKQPGNLFKFDEHIDCFYLPAEVDPNSVYDIISTLPKYIYESDRETLLNKIEKNSDTPRKYLELAFEKHYRKTGKIWHVGKMNRASIYSFIIEKYFPNGIRIYDSDELIRFKGYVQKEFGNIDFSENDRAIWGIVQRSCILFDRGVYIHPSKVTISDELVNKIEAFFIESGRTSMAYHELYDKFADELVTQENITNRYALQGVLRDKWNDKYVFFRDGISTKEGYKITQELETYIRKNSPVSKETMMAAFSGITEAMLMQNIARLPSVILTENSTYIHSKRLKLTVGDHSIIKIIKAYTDDCPVTASKLLETLYTTHSDFLFRNNISTPNTLFGILQFMFSDEFSFSRPYISSLSMENISKREIILSLLEGQEYVNIPDLISLCEEHHLAFQSSTLVIRALQDYFLRINDDTLVSTAYIHVTDEKLHEIKDLLSDAILSKGYLVIKSIDNFIFYPDLGFPWTPYLLRSILDKYFIDDFLFIDNPINRDISYDLIVDPRLGVNNYEDLVRSVIRTEHQHDPFKDQASIVLWLVNEGFLTEKAIVLKEGPDLLNSTSIRLVNRNIPKFITDDNFMYVDEYGKLIIG